MASVDGLEVQGWLYRTPGEATGTIVLIHGGPTSHAEDRFNAQIQYLLSRGFDVLAPNYRGSTGFGLPFQESIKDDGWGGREQEDIRSGIEALIEAGVAEPGRVGVTGTSYGGYSAWWAITHFAPDLVAAAAPICGMTDLVVDYYATRPDLRPYSEEMMGGSPEEVPDRYRERSPINFVETSEGDLLIVQGLQDPNVTPDNVHAVTKALRRETSPTSSSPSRTRATASPAPRTCGPLPAPRRLLPHSLRRISLTRSRALRIVQRAIRGDREQVLLYGYQSRAITREMQPTKKFWLRCLVLYVRGTYRCRTMKDSYEMEALQ